MVEIDSGWWEWHLLCAVSGPYFLIWIGLGTVVKGSAVGDAVVLFVGLWVFVFAAAMWGALIGYGIEARQLRGTESEWIPNPWLYGLGHLLLTPAIVAPIYLYQRRKHIGIPWAEARTVRLLRGLAALPRIVARRVRSPR